MLRGLEKYYEDYCKSIRQEAEVLREGPMPVITEELFAETALFECSRQDFSDHSGICRDVWLLQWEVPLAGAVGQVTARFSVTAL